MLGPSEEGLRHRLRVVARYVISYAKFSLTSAGDGTDAPEATAQTLLQEFFPDQFFLEIASASTQRLVASPETTRVTIGVEQGDKTRRLVASNLEKRVGAGERVRLRKCPQDGTNAHPSHRTMHERHCCSIKIDPSEAVAYHGA